MRVATAIATDNYRIAIWPPKPEILIFSGTMTDNIEILTANLEFLTTARLASSIKVCPNNCDNDRHLEIELQLLWR